MSRAAALLQPAVANMAAPAISGLLARAPLIQRSCAVCGGGKGAEERCPTYEDEAMAGAVQPKLEIGAPDDPLEKEADEVADKVMRMPAGPVPSAIHADHPEGPLRREASGPATAPPAPGFSAALGSRSGGAPLSADALGFFEPRFGRDLGHVRIHDNASAGGLARAINARAFTLGAHIYFAHGHYDPKSSAGRRLLAHEIVHVVQQGSGSSCRRISRQTSPGPAPAKKPLPGEGMEAPGDCEPKEYKSLKDDVTKECKTAKRGCRAGSDKCPELKEKIEQNARCIRARARMNARCFKGGELLHALDVMMIELGVLASCWALYEKCLPPPEPVPVPEKQTVPVPVAVPTHQTQPTAEPRINTQPDPGFMERMEKATGLTGAALVIYLIVSEGSRVVFPPRNLIPVP